MSTQGTHGIALLLAAAAVQEVIDAGTGQDRRPDPSPIFSATETALRWIQAPPSAVDVTVSEQPQPSPAFATPGVSSADGGINSERTTSAAVKDESSKADTTVHKTMIENSAATEDGDEPYANPPSRTKSMPPGPQADLPQGEQSTTSGAKEESLVEEEMPAGTLQLVDSTSTSTEEARESDEGLEPITIEDEFRLAAKAARNQVLQNAATSDDGTVTARRSTRHPGKRPAEPAVVRTPKLRCDAGKKRKPVSEAGTTASSAPGSQPPTRGASTNPASTKAVSTKAAPMKIAATQLRTAKAAPTNVRKQKADIYWDHHGNPRPRRWFLENNEPRMKASFGRPYEPLAPEDANEIVYMPHKRVRLVDGSWEDPEVLEEKVWKESKIPYGGKPRPWPKDAQFEVSHKHLEDRPRSGLTDRLVKKAERAKERYWKSRFPNSGNIEVINDSEDETDGESNYVLDGPGKIKKRKRG
ncbi:hypothetical protein P154DRAFT_593975 [Amniculicola lignicola CBS 123094]|uniref:Uncharacterized protein n=1 Tax=Amniculicola lignicola CBS 123094 TaxID=1392246 RepID=A0A6A5VVZ2_9PLEO|nr:hypothetical protein P154DRAFT_593975 [Amniculicola lignicola CBS 123094]